MLGWLFPSPVGIGYSDGGEWKGNHVAYRFEPDESVREAIRRCSDEQLRRAEQELKEGVNDNPVAAVHAARKAVKRERALLRLSRDAISSSRRREENAALRDAARRLSETRDAEVVVQVLDDLSHRFAGQLPESAFTAFRERLAARRNSARSRLHDPTLSATVVDELSAVRLRIADWRLKRGGWKALDGGLRRTYRRGRDAFEQARAEPDVTHLHEWRKRSKDLWYELRLLGPVCGHAVRGQAKDAHELSDLLGDDHDLAVLRQTLIQLGGDVPADLDAVLGLIDVRRDQLQTQALHVGERVYAEKPSAFRRRIHTCWRAGRSQARAARSRDPSQVADATRSLVAT
jgi:CHAD domain-containing protein